MRDLGEVLELWTDLHLRREDVSRREDQRQIPQCFRRRARSLKIGDPTSPDTDLGPMVSKKERETSKSFVEKAKEENDKIILGGGIPKNFTRGFYFEPTVIEDVAGQKSPLIQEE